MDFTTYADTARYVAAAALLPRVPSVIHVAGDTLDFAQLVTTYTAETGRRLEIQRLGTLDELDAEIDRRRATDPGDLMAWLPLMYQRAMLRGRGKLGPQANAIHDDRTPTTVAEYVRTSLS